MNKRPRLVLGSFVRCTWLDVIGIVCEIRLSKNNTCVIYATYNGRKMAFYASELTVIVR